MTTGQHPQILVDVSSGPHNAVNGTAHSLKQSEKGPSEMISADTQIKAEKSKEEAQNEADKDKLIQFDLGVWRIIMEKTPQNPAKAMNNVFNDARTILRLVKDVYQLGPWLFVIMVLTRTWHCLEPLVLLALSSRLLRIIEEGLRTGKPDAEEITKALLLRLITAAFVALLQKFASQCEMVLQGRVRMHFDAFILQQKLQLGLCGPEESQVNVDSSTAWETFESLCNIGGRLLEVLGHISFLWHLSSSNSDGPIFAACCLGNPVLVYLVSPQLWNHAYVRFYGNEDWKRLKSLESLGGSECREEVVTGNLKQYILKEYQNSRSNLKDTLIDHPAIIWQTKTSATITMFLGFSEDLPMVYYAANAIMNPTKFSVASIATLQQSSSLIRGSFSILKWLTQRFRSHVLEVKRLYSLEDIKPTVKDGSLPYPSQESEKRTGMSFDLRDVSFSYPTTKTKEPALKNISCSIKAGQMVVIVGANGSGKSTLIKLLNRLYDPTSGIITVDNHDITSYRLDDYRSSVATLTQDHSIFGVSVGENIGLGYTEESGNEELLMKAAEQGGAKGVIAKFKDGLFTTLGPNNDTYGVRVSEHDDTPLGRALKKMEKTIKVSGGEKQRLVAARTFMRFESGRITFVAVDEPSSAMDPEAEFQLFRNLRSWRDGKTMIFVTHRFGHLTKHADLILCMKDGTLVESGTHETLMTVGGEYSKLYKIQAEAFEAPAKSS